MSIHIITIRFSSTIQEIFNALILQLAVTIDFTSTYYNEMKIITNVYIVLLLMSYSILNAQAPRTFYIGHSLSDQIPDMVQSLSNDDPDVEFSWVYQSIPGAPLRWQWDRKDAMDYGEIVPNYYGFYDPDNGLPTGDFDVLVLTEAVPRYGELINETYEYADSFYRYATAFSPDIQVYLYEDWHCLQSGTPTACSYDVDSNPWRQRLTDDLPMWESVVDTLNARFNPSIPICLIPAGQGLAALYDSIQVGAIPNLTAIENIFSDDIHLTDIGKYYIACIHFAMIHGKSPVGLTNQTQVWWGGDFDPPSPALALKFQEMAWETVLRYPRSCVNSTTTSNISLEQDAIFIYPNPTDNIFVVKGMSQEVLESYSIQVLDSMGAVLQTYTPTSDEVQIALDGLPDGLYFIRILNTLNSNLSVQKILKNE